jgi:hypothetical protein
MHDEVRDAGACPLKISQNLSPTTEINSPFLPPGQHIILSLKLPVIDCSYE